MDGRSRLKWLVPGGEEEEGRKVTWFKLDKAITDNILGNIESNLPEIPCPLFKEFPEDVNQSWWNLFAQKFNWQEEQKGEIKKWEQLASSQYSHHMKVWKSAWLKGKDKPRRLPQTHWEYFQGYWQQDETKHKSDTVKWNRCGTNEKHVGTHNNANGVRPDHLTLMKVSHPSRKTGTIENKKIKKVIDTANERIESRIIELTQQGTPVSSLHVEEINNIVYESTEKKKGQTLGLGSVPITQALSVASTSLNREMQNKILRSRWFTHVRPGSLCFPLSLFASSCRCLFCFLLELWSLCVGQLLAVFEYYRFACDISL